MVVAVSSGDIVRRDTFALDQDIVRRCGIGCSAGQGVFRLTADDEPSSAVSTRRVRL